jgi:hypothetical protein
MRYTPEQRKSAFYAKSLRSSRQFEIRLSAQFKIGAVDHVPFSSVDSDDELM